MIDFVMNDRKWVKPNQSETALKKYLLPGHINLMAEMVIEYKHFRRKDPEWILYDMFKGEGETNEIMESLEQREDA